MSVKEHFKWIRDLSVEEVRAALGDRGLSEKGILPTLRTRLLRYEAAQLAGKEHIPTPEMSDASDEEDSEELEGAVGGEPKAGPSKPMIRVHPPTPPGVTPEAHGVLEPRLETRGVPELRTETRRVPDSHPPRMRTPYAMDAYNIMRKWNLNFSGARNGEAEAFLIRIEQGRQLILLEDEEIFKCLPFFLSGTAAHWFRLNKPLWRTWGQFEAAWRSRFGCPNFQFTLRDEIMRRKQGEDEPVVDYITCMQALLERLDPPWQLTEQLNYAHRNMLPRLRVAVRRKEVYDFRSLETLASQVEECYEPDRQPNQTRSIFPELAYRATPRQLKHSKPMAAAGIAATKPKGKKNANTEPKKASVNAIEKANSDPKSSSSAANNPRVAEIRCWNCDGKGHRSRDCSQARNLHCYRCGKKQHTTRTCPNCQGNGEESR